MLDFGMLFELIKTFGDPVGSSKFARRNTIGKNNVNGLIISTVVTVDLGPETAIIDKNGTYPVQRYNDKVDAEKGHAEWVEKAKTIKKATKLGYPGITEDEEITLVR